MDDLDVVSGSRSATVAPETTTGVDELGDGIGIDVENGVDVIGTSETWVSGVGRVKTGRVLLMASFCGCGGVMSCSFGRFADQSSRDGSFAWVMSWFGGMSG
jgi:succinate dehydrogenase/fumarate reductase flavoprotein subunit